MAPCWFSYGSLPCHEYPFTLRRLIWGLRDDAAFKQFCRYQSSAQTTVIEPILDSWVEDDDNDDGEYWYDD